MGSFDFSIVGGGIIGVAIAYQIQKKYPNKNLAIFEKEKNLAMHQTGRNSGVIHSGLYYKPGSLKAKNCFIGREKLIEFAKKYNIYHDVCGKIVVATNNDELSRLSFLKKNGEINGLTGLELLNPNQFKEIEPFVEGLKALKVPQSGIINYSEVVRVLSEKITFYNNSSCILTSCKVLDYHNNIISTTKGNFKTKHIIFCGGLFADRLAVKDNIDLNMQTVGFRGDYYKLSDNAKHKVNHLIYPVPNPDFPFLGVHFTRMYNNDIECGPNAVFSFKREGYKKLDFSFKDTFEALTFQGTYKLFINNWKFAMDEYKRAFSKSLFLKQLHKLMPSLKNNDIVSYRSGVRAILLSNDGNVVDDFKIVNMKNNIHVLNAPSPAATACLAIGEKVLCEIEKNFNL
mgnify:FL=1